ncbi:NRDE protein-domain-containing protein [Chytridium lagenaria]|nr:NRDE protein-domain-containing protein [Chytridium lagenaria]
MCIIFFAYGGVRHRLIIAANRDESIRRPTNAAHFWKHADHVLGGVDLGYKTQFSKPLASGNAPAVDDDVEPDGTGEPTPPMKDVVAASMGTWLGVTKNGRFSFITNFREHPKHISPDALSRGVLVSHFLQGAETPEDYAKSVAESGDLYNGFNLVVGTVWGDAWFIGNRDDRRPVRLERNRLYGISNGTLAGGEGWPKVVLGKNLLKDVLLGDRDEESLVEYLLDTLRNKTLFEDHQLPVNYNLDVERLCAPICIDQERSKTWEYGTRTHTVVVVDNEDAAHFVEVDRYVDDEDGKLVLSEQRRDFEFVMRAKTPPAAL